MTSKPAIIRAKFLFPIHLIFCCLALITASISGFVIASYPQAVYLILLALVVVVALLIISQRPEWGLLLSIFLIVVQRNPELPIAGRLLTLSEITLVLTLLAWLVQNIRQRNKVNLYAPHLLGPFFFFIFIAVASLLNSFNFTNIGLGLAELFARVYLMLFLVIISSYTTSTNRYQRVVLAFIASAILVIGVTALHFLFQRIGFDPLDLGHIKFKALFRNPNALAGYITAVFLTFLPLALSQRSVMTFRLSQLLARWSLPGLLVALVLSDSQGAYLGIIAGVLAWPIIRLYKRLGLILVMLALFISIVAPFGVLTLSKSMDNFTTDTLKIIGFEQSRVPVRLALVEIHSQAIFDHPIMGIGIGQLGKYTYYLSEGKDDSVSHFTGLGILAETGIMGILAVSIILMSFLKIIKENVTLKLDKASGWLQFNEGLIIAFIGMLVFGLTHDIQTNRTLWLILALIVSLKPASLFVTSIY